MTSSIETLLAKLGPSRSSSLVQHLTKTGVAPEAARKRVSRSGGRVQRLSYIRLPKNESFLFLDFQYGTQEYWNSLFQALSDSGSVYGAALNGLMARGGIVPLACFKVISGAPVAQKRQISSERVQEGLLRAKLIELHDDEEIEQYVQITPYLMSSEVRSAKARLITENILLWAVRDWLRKINISGYDSTALRDYFEPERPKFGTCCWDIVGPSYIYPLRENSENQKTRPGFFVGDVFSDSLNVNSIQYIDRKTSLSRSLKNLPSFITMILAAGYTSKAFKALKSKGYIVATPGALFGDDIAQMLNALLEVLVDAGRIAATAPEKIAEIFSTLTKIEGAANNLRGALFEHIVGHLVKKSEGGSINIGEKVLDPETGLQREIDVRRSKAKEYCHVYECKGYLPNKQVLNDEIDTWLSEKVPIIYSALKSRPSFQEVKFEFSFWTTGKLSDEAIAALNKANAKQSKYVVSWKHGRQVLQYSQKAKSKSISDTLKEHYFKNPVNFVKLRPS